MSKVYLIEYQRSGLGWTFFDSRKSKRSALDSMSGVLIYIPRVRRARVVIVDTEGRKVSVVQAREKRGKRG